MTASTCEITYTIRADFPRSICDLFRRKSVTGGIIDEWIGWKNMNRAFLLGEAVDSKNF